MNLIASLSTMSLGVAIQSTGGYVSTINGAAESPNRTKKQSIQAMSMGALFDNAFWCLADQYGTQVYNQCKNHIVTDEVD